MLKYIHASRREPVMLEKPSSVKMTAADLEISDLFLTPRICDLYFFITNCTFDIEVT